MRQSLAASPLRASRRVAAGRSARAVRRLAAAVAIPLAGLNGLAAATSYTWYGSGSGGAAGGTGTWNTSSLDWTSNGTTFGAWPTTGTTNTADLGGTGGNVTIAGAISVNTINFSASGYSLFSSGGNLTLDGTSPTINTGGFNVAFGMAANTLALASGDTTISKIGAGTLTLSNSQNGTGGIAANTTWNISGGTLSSSSGLYSSTIAIADGTDLGVNTGCVVNLDDATLAFTQSGGAGFSSARLINISADGGAISDGGFAPGEGGGGSTLAPQISIAAGNGLNLVSADILELDNPSISGAGGITVYGTGTVEILSTNNSYSGGTTITAGAKLIAAGNTAGSNSSLGVQSGNLSVAGTLSMLGNQTVGRLTSVGGNSTVSLPPGSTYAQFVAAFPGNGSANPANGDTLDFKIGNGTITQLIASSAVTSGATGIELDPLSGSSITPGTYTLISSPGGGLNGGSLTFAGGQNLTVPANSAIENIGGANYRLTLGGNATAATVTVAPAPSHTINIMPLGSSITAGQSAQPVYDGGGYRSQLYENLINDGRFTPEFVGSSTSTEANNPTGNDLMTAVGQTHHEGHPGYTTTDVLGNLNANAGTGGNDGGFWLKSGNGVNPDYVTLNIGGNDYAYNPAVTGVINNLDTIITDIVALRPNATIIVSSIVYRGDVPAASAAFEASYNPLMPGLVYQHVLAGQHVEFVDMNHIITPNNSLALIGPDLIHPTQAGYDLMGNAWYQAITTGQAFYTGSAGSTWNAAGSGNTTSWDLDYQRTTDAGVLPSAGTDVYFNGVGGTTTLGADFSVRSVNFTAGATTPVTISGNNTLTIGVGGITVQAGTAAHSINCPVTLGAAQAWSNVSTNQFTVSGNVGGSGNLTIGGNGTILLSGNNTYDGPTLISGGTLQAGSVTVGTVSGAFGVGSSVTMANVAGATLNLNNFNNSIGSLTGGGSAGGNVTLGNATLTVGSDNTSPAAYSGIISGTGALTKIGAGTLTLSSNNTFSSGTTVSAGTLILTAGGGIGTIQGILTIGSGAATILAAQDALGYTAGSQVSNVFINGGTLTNTSGSSNGYITSFTLQGGTMAATGAGSYYRFNTGGYGLTSRASSVISLISAPLVLSFAPNMPISVASGSTTSGVDLSITGAISDNFYQNGVGASITKSGTGVLALSGNNTYVSGTTINAGTLLVNNTSGSGTGSGAVAVNSGATLGGTGIISGNVTVNGTITAGQSPTTGAPGVLSAAGTTIFAAGGFCSTKISSTTTNDMLALGTLAGPSSGNFTVTLVSDGNNTNSTAITGGLSPSVSNTWQIGAVSTIGGNITLLGSGPTVLATDGGSGAPTITPGDANEFVLSTASFASTNGTSQNNSSYALELIAAGVGGGFDLDVVYSATPEPGTTLLFLAGAMPMLAARRRRRSPMAKLSNAALESTRMAEWAYSGV